MNISEILEKIRLRRYMDLELAWSLGELFSQGIGYEEIKAEAERAGVDPLPKSRWRDLIRIYDYFGRQCGLGKEDLRGISTSKLVFMAKVALPPSHLPPYLEMAKASSYQTLREAIEMKLEQIPLREKFRTVRVPESVYNAWMQSLAYLSETLQKDALTPTQYMEFLSEMISNMPASTLRTIWNTIYGPE